MRLFVGSLLSLFIGLATQAQGTAAKAPEAKPAPAAAKPANDPKPAAKPSDATAAKPAAEVPFDNSDSTVSEPVKKPKSAAAPSAAAPTDGGDDTPRNGPCTQDVATYCSDVPRGGHRIAMCLQQNLRKVSNECKEVVRARMSAAREFREACKTDIDAHCNSVQTGPNSQFRCLRLNMTSLSSLSRKAVEATIERRQTDERTPTRRRAQRPPADGIGEN